MQSSKLLLCFFVGLIFSCGAFAGGLFEQTSFVPEKIYVTLKPLSTPNPTILVEYQRNGQIYYNTTWEVDPSVTLANQPSLKFEYPYISAFYNTILEDPIFNFYNSSTTFYYSASQYSALTIVDQNRLNDEAPVYPVKVQVILGASEFGLDGGRYFHAGVLVYTDNVINYLVPYIYAQ